MNRTVIRMRYPHQQENTLHGYIFMVRSDARDWLLNPAVQPDKIMLEEIEIGDLARCRHCDGSGYVQPVTWIRTMTVAEFLAEDPTPQPS